VWRGYRAIESRVEPTCPDQYGRGFLWLSDGVQSGPSPNEVGSITTADAGAVARLHDRGGIPGWVAAAMSLNSCNTGSHAVESLKGSNSASNALRSVLMMPDAISPLPPNELSSHEWNDATSFACNLRVLGDLVLFP